MKKNEIEDSFFFNDTATTEIYTLSLHDALPIFADDAARLAGVGPGDDGAILARPQQRLLVALHAAEIRKSTRLNSSHANISYAVFCLKKKKNSTLLSCSLTPLILSISYNFSFTV